MPLTDKLKSFTQASEYMRKLYEVQEGLCSLGNTDAFVSEQKATPGILTAIDSDIEEVQAKLLSDSGEEAVDTLDGDKTVTDMESALKLQQALALTMSRSLWQWLKNTDRAAAVWTT